MTKETFDLAKSLDAQIKEFESNRRKIERTLERKNDDDFNWIRSLCYDLLGLSIIKMKQRFNSL